MYKVKPGGVYKHLAHFSEEQIKLVMAESKDVMKELQYLSSDMSSLKLEEELSKEANEAYFMNA